MSTSTEPTFAVSPADMNEADFVALFGGVYEHSSWVAEQTWRQGLDAAQNTPAGLSAAMQKQIASADRKRLMALINAHPDLAGKAAVRGELTAESTSEQAGAGISECTAEEFEQFQQYNEAYKKKFGFPFIMAVKGSNRHKILAAFAERLNNDAETEYQRALSEINNIARFRLDAIAGAANTTRQLTIKLESLTSEAFAPFGDVVEIEGAKHFSINRGTVERYHDLANVDTSAQDGRTLVSIVCCNEPATLPYTLPFVERHLLGSQSFIPMDNTPIVVAVAEAGEPPASGNLRAFISNGQQGINYHKGVWHMPMLFLNADQRMIVVDRGGPGDNCDEHHFPGEKIVLSLS